MAMNPSSFSLKTILLFKGSSVCSSLNKVYSTTCLRGVLNRVNALRVLKTPWSSGFVRTHGSDAKSLLDRMCSIDILSKVAYTRLSGIICTIGPSSREVATLEKMIDAGMDVAMIDFARGSRDYHAETIANIRKAIENYNRRIGKRYPLAIALETRKPGITTGSVEEGVWAKVKLEAGASIRFTTDDVYVDKCSSKVIYVDYGNITKVVKVGAKMFLDYGRVSFVVTAVGSNFLDCVVENSGILRSNKDINIPGITLDLPDVHDKIMSDIEFVREHDVDMIFASHINSADVIHDIRRLLGDKCKDVMVVGCIENRRGIDNLDEIIAASDGIIVGRGSLSTEIGYEGVFTAQTSIMARCNRAGKPVICATQMLESMVEKPGPTRAEVSDVGNAIVGGADCVMLSSETEVGAHPLESLATMDRVCREAEATMWQRQRFSELSGLTKEVLDAGHTVAIAAVRASYLAAAVAIVVFAVTGKSARLVSRYRPMCPVVVVSVSERVARHNQLYRALFPVASSDAPLQDWYNHFDECVRFGLEVGLERDIVDIEGTVVVVTYWSDASSYADTVQVLPVADVRDRRARA